MSAFALGRVFKFDETSNSVKKRPRMDLDAAIAQKKDDAPWGVMLDGLVNEHKDTFTSSEHNAAPSLRTATGVAWGISA
jgi:hypothetical protein